MATAAEEWSGEDVSVARIEHELARLRAEDDGAPRLRTSVMTHMAWVPEEWLPAALATLEGLGERHPSRTLILTPEPEAGGDRLDARVRLERFQLPEIERQICSEVIELRLRGGRVRAPASIVTPLLVADLPVFLRWRGRPPFGAPELEQLVDVTDRLVVDSGEWPDLPAAYAELSRYFERAAVSDIAWARTLGRRRALASMWPGIAKLRQLRVAGPLPEALLLAGWLRSRLKRDVELLHDEAEALELVAVDGEAVPASRDEERSPSDLLSDQLDEFGRDPIYEEAVTRAAAAA